MKELTKRKLLAKLGMTEVCCDKCGHKLKAEGYNKTVCSSCGRTVDWVFGNYWSRSAIPSLPEYKDYRKDPFMKHFQKGKEHWDEFIPVKEAKCQ